MKRLLCPIIILCLLLCICGCQHKDTPKEPVRFYYPRTAENITYGQPDSAFAFELRESAGHTGDYLYLLRLYCLGPNSDGLVHPFPKGVTPLSLQVEDGIATLVLNDAFATLSGGDLTIACTCLAMTIHALTDAIVVNISAETLKLDQAERITMSIDKLLFMDDVTVQEDTH